MALRAEPGEEVVEITYQGRPAWLLETPVQMNRLSEESADHMQVTVDQETGFPVRVVETRLERFVEEVRLEDLGIDPILGPGAFDLTFPLGVEVIRTDAGFRRVEPAEAASVVGYEPLLPTQLPAGFVFGGMAVGEVGQSTGKEGMNPAAAGVVSVIYRRGFDRLVISTRLVGDDPSLWSDPLASGEGFIDEPERVKPTSGALAGATAEVVIDAREAVVR